MDGCAQQGKATAQGMFLAQLGDVIGSVASDDLGRLPPRLPFGPSLADVGAGGRRTATHQPLWPLPSRFPARTESLWRTMSREPTATTTMIVQPQELEKAPDEAIKSHDMEATNQAQHRRPSWCFLSPSHL